MDSILTESVRSFGGPAAPSTATGTRVPKDVMFLQLPGTASQSGTSTQSHAGVRPVKEKGRKNHYCHLCQYFTSRKEDLDNHLGFKD